MLALLKVVYPTPDDRMTSARGCSGKQKYPTRKEAERAMVRMHSGHNANAYLCQQCNSWHWGRRPTCASIKHPGSKCLARVTPVRLDRADAEVLAVPTT